MSLSYSYDEITGLPLLSSTYSLIEEKLKQGQQIGYLYFDIVQFHILINVYGRTVTDSLLRELGISINTQVGKLFREDDVVAIGGPGVDYFVILLLSPPRRQNQFSQADVKRISLRVLQYLTNTANEMASRFSISEKVDFHAGYSIILPEQGVTVSRLVYEAQKEASLKGEMDELMVNFISNVTHELRTPLTCIKGYVETLLDGAIDDKELACKWLGIVDQEAKRLENLISDLLLISMMESQQSEFHMEYFQLKELLMYTRDVLLPNAKKAGVDIEVVCPDDIPPVLLDKEKISQVLLNIIDNAIKYSPTDSTVSAIVTNYAPGWVRIDIEDRGIGIPDSQLSRIFERFYRVSRGNQVKYGGRGLGLAIAKSIAEAHGGGVYAKNGVEEGSVFSIELPVDGVPKTNATDEEEEQNNSEDDK